MQTSDFLPGGVVPPSSGGSTSEITQQFRNYQLSQQRILLRRIVQFWWYPILFVILGGIAVVLIIAAVRLFRRSRSINAPEIRHDRILGLVGLGLVCGSMTAVLFASYFFLPPRQSLHVTSLPQALVSWIIYGCVLYKDQLWRMARKGKRVEN